MSTKVNTAIVLFKKRQKKNGKYPAKLRITCDRRQMYYNIDSKHRTYEFFEAEFEKIISPKPRGEYKNIQLEFSLIEEKAQRIIASMSYFSFELFKTHMGIGGSDMRNVYRYLDIKTKEYTTTGYGDKAAQSLKGSLQLFFKREKTLQFKEITVEKLKEFERYMQDKGIKPTTYRRYIDSLKNTFVMAQNENVIPLSINPFGREKYTAPRAITIKRALKLAEIEKIYNYEPELFSHEDEAKDYWLLSYLCNGINMADLFNLKYQDIGTEFISFIRKKTERTSGIRKHITIPITEDIRRIIKKRGNLDKSPENFVFPVLTKGLTTFQERYKVAWRVTKTNSHMKKIGEKLGIEKHITTYTARHSFATILKRSGVSTEFISESLGHKDLKITETYLDSFENEQKIEVAKHLTAFKH